MCQPKECRSSLSSWSSNDRFTIKLISCVSNIENAIFRKYNDVHIRAYSFHRCNKISCISVTWYLKFNRPLDFCQKSHIVIYIFLMYAYITRMFRYSRSSRLFGLLVHNTCDLRIIISGYITLKIEFSLWSWRLH